MPEYRRGASPISLPTLPLLEYWKPIPRWDDLYEISNMGRVWSKRSGKERKSFPNKKGYMMVQLSRGGVVNAYQVHGFVAKLFVGDRPPGLVVNHIDGWKRKNWASNFEYLTSLENTRHAMRIGTYKPGTYQSKLDELDISNIRELLTLGLYTTEIASLYAIHNSAISRIKNGKFKTRPKEKIEGREFRGEGYTRAQLSESDVIEIRRLRPAVTLKDLAQRFGVSMGVICDAALGKIWSHLSGARPKGEAKSGPRSTAPTVVDLLKGSC
jgi:NUMOD4 motif/HNH endonuclease